ncbi:efflux RND transporter permease subunit, partial [Bacillus licheniformis]|nr:efflux RND transporter permease subunit [Bacillus licheniformis]
MMFSLSRARLAPAVFGRLGANGVPRAALWISTSGVAVAAVLVAVAPDTAFTVMMAIAMFGALFTWLMIFVTHLRFRSQYRGPALAFRMWGHPFGSLLGAGLVAAILLTTAFTREFRMTMVVGVVFVVLLFLQGWRPSIIPILSIPVSLVGTFAAMAVLGYSINNLTLFGLVLAVGIVVDNAIV